MNKYFGIILGTALLAFAHPELIPFLSLLASMCGYAILWHGIRAFPSKKMQVTLLFISFSFIHAVHFSWLARPEYHGTPILILYGLLTLFYALAMGVLSLIVLERGKTLFQAIICASFFVFFEWAMAHFLCGFTIDQIGLHLLWHPIAAQMGAFFGGLFLTFLVIVTNILIFLSIEQKQNRKMALILLLTPYLFGIPHYYLKEKAARAAGHLNVGILQTGLRPEQKRLLPGRVEQFIPLPQQWKNILRLAKKLKTKKILDCVLLPEAALPYAAYSPSLPKNIADAVIRAEFGEIALPEGEGNIVATYDGLYATNAYLCTAISTYLNTLTIAGLLHEEGEKNFSCAFAFFPDGQNVEIYEKRVLVPIAEGAPFEFLRAISQKYGIAEYFTPGKNYKPFTGPIDIVPNICYEEMRGDLLRRYTTRPQFFVNLSNDVWYPNSTLPERHYTHGKLRAIENGVSYVRSCNTGISAALSPTGREIARIDNDEGQTEWVHDALIAKIPAISFATPYAKFGDFPLLILLGIVIILDLLPKYRVSHRLKKIMSILKKETGSSF